ncbi:hypothetical protein [Burkholderia ambifaria]|uniref:hypothetical protein n=1 Tax=Burkholderia ambifaria TaxID=152480 RepID=UPI00158EA226|nr:hypothetical protein [Burkholderia ambifaria]
MSDYWLTMLMVGAQIIFVSNFAFAEERVVSLWRVVPSNYYDDDFDSSSFDKIIAQSPTRMIDVKKDDTISSILKEHYNISQKWTPSVYKNLEENVQQLNDIAEPKYLKPGQIRIPDIPETPRRPSFKESTIRRPRFSSGTGAVMKWNASAGVFLGRPKLEAISGMSTLQVRQVPISALKDMHISSALQLPLSPTDYSFMVFDYPMKVNLATQGTQNSTSPILDAEAIGRLNQMMQIPAKTHPLVVVLDDSWPSKSDFLNSIRFIAAASRDIRRKFGLDGFALRDSNDIRILDNLQNTSFCNGCEYPATRLHAAMIKQSLKEFTDLDGNGRVQTLYFPLAVTQTGADAALREIIYVSLLARSLGSALSLTNPAEVSDISRKAASEEATRIVSLPDLSAVQTPYHNAPMSTSTDKAIIESAANFLQLYAAANKRPFLLSMSWTSRNLEYPAYFQSNMYGLLLAAAGNDPTVNIHADLVQFAARSVSPGDVLAVESSETGPRRCVSSTFTPQGDIPVFGLALSGIVTDTLCGTSFATPRLAWLIAMRESTYGSIPTTKLDWNNWSTRLKTQLMELQHKGANGLSRYTVSPIDVLKMN